MIDAYYAEDLALLANTHAQAESLVQSLELAAQGIGLNTNANKNKFYVFQTRKSNLSFKLRASKITEPIHILRHQNLNHWNWYQPMPNEDVDRY